jgi:hypothetical protein
MVNKAIVGLLLSLTVTFSNAPIALAADTKAPELIGWKIIDSSVDITNSPGRLRVEFSIFDESGISAPSVQLKSVTTTQSISLFPTLANKIGNLSYFTSEIQIKVGQAPGLWKYFLYLPRDEFGNYDINFTLMPNWPVEVWVYDKDFKEVDRIAQEQAAQKIILEKEKEQQRENEKAESVALLVRILLLRQKYDDPKLPLTEFMRELEASRKSKDEPYAKETRAKISTQVDSLEQKLIKESNVKAKATTITCIKGKLAKKVTAVNPKCPAGYRKK